MEMVLGELLHNNGYKLKTIDIDKINNVSIQGSDVLIIDFPSISQIVKPALFKNITKKFNKILIIYGDDDSESIESYHDKNVHTLPKPIDIDRIIKAIET